MKSLLIKISMLLLLSTTVLVFPSCSDPSPDNKIIATDSTHTGWNMGKQVYTTVVAIAPTWGQSFYFAFKTGYTPWFILSLVLLAIAAYIFYCKTADRGLISKGGRTPNVVLIIVFLVAAICVWGTKPAIVKWDNYKPIPKTQYDFYMKRDGNIKAVWDSLFNENRIQGANNK